MTRLKARLRRKFSFLGGGVPGAGAGMSWCGEISKERFCRGKSAVGVFPVQWLPDFRFAS